MHKCENVVENYMNECLGKRLLTKVFICASIFCGLFVLQISVNSYNVKVLLIYTFYQNNVKFYLKLWI